MTMMAEPTLAPEKKLKSGTQVPKTAAARFFLGNKFYDKGEFTRALRDYEAALEIAPDLPEAHYNRGLGLGHLGRYKEALVAFEQALDLRPDYAEAIEGRKLTIQLLMHRLARRGIVSGGRGGKPKGSDRPVTLTPGPPISSYIIEDRR